MTNKAEGFVSASTEHTPTPWKHVYRQSIDDFHHVVGYKPRGVIIANCGRQARDDGLTATNARFIVTACNHFEEMRRLLKRAEEEIGSLRDYFNVHQEGGSNKVICHIADLLTRIDAENK